MNESYNKASEYWLNAFNSWAKMAGSFSQAASTADAEKNKQGSMDIFEYYTKASKYWMDMFNSWSKTVGGAPQQFGGVGPETWLKQPWSNMEGWTKLYERFTDMAKAMPFSFASMKNSSEAVAKSMDSYVKTYNTWLKGMDSVLAEGYSIAEKIGLGEDVETDKFFDTMKTTYNNITVTVVELLKETPFAGLEGLDKVVMDALNAIPEDQTMAREFLKEMISFSTKMTSMSSEVMKEVNKTSGDMLANGTISGEGYKKLIKKYGDTLKHSVEVLREKAAVVPGYKGMADEATNWAKTNLDLSVSWLEMNLKLYQGIDKSFKDISNKAQELFKGENISTADDFQKKWVEVYKNSLDVFIDETQFSENIHNLMNNYADSMKSTNELYRSLMTSPYVAKDDFNKVFNDLEKVKKSVKKQASKKVKDVPTEEK
jgi:hypothetical protein